MDSWLDLSTFLRSLLSVSVILFVKKTFLPDKFQLVPYIQLKLVGECLEKCLHLQMAMHPSNPLVCLHVCLHSRRVSSEHIEKSPIHRCHLAFYFKLNSKLSHKILKIDLNACCYFHCNRVKQCYAKIKARI